MKVLSFLGAVGLGLISGAWIFSLYRRSGAGAVLLNINQATQEELMHGLGLDTEMAERIVEHRPYPSKIDLLGRMVIPQGVYDSIKHRISYKAS